MREIKFRGKHIHAFVEPNNTGIWVYGYLCNDHYINSEELMGEMLVDKDTVGQFTGLKDVDGTEIYEGDILEETGHFYMDNDRKTYSEVKWKANYSCWLRGDYQRLTPNNIKKWKCRVVGNIWDNKELLDEI